jgi:hypothetical protein
VSLPTDTVPTMAEQVAGHQARLVKLGDGRYTVRCRNCEQGQARSVPVGIGVPISNRFEAESIARNHGGYAA